MSPVQSVLYSNYSPHTFLVFQASDGHMVRPPGKAVFHLTEGHMPGVQHKVKGSAGEELVHTHICFAHELHSHLDCRGAF